jgi:hypothetical protein
VREPDHHRFVATIRAFLDSIDGEEPRRA